MIELKRNSKNMTLDQAHKMAKEFLNKTKHLVPQEYKFDFKQTPAQKKFITEYLKNELRKELNSKPKTKPKTIG